MEKIHTGVNNLDRLLGGGLPKTMMMLVKGEPGAGKSNLGLEFLYRGAMNGENGLYVSFQETADDIVRANTFDWKFEDCVESEKISITKFDPYRYERVADMLRSAVKQNGAKRVVLDPITDLDLYIDSRKDIRKTLLSVKDEMRDMGVTTMLIAENEEATEIEEEIADGIINMQVDMSEGHVQRKMYVKKLRGSDYNQGVHSYIFENDGLKIQ
ncbi:MAG: RAD55 family ATPase [Candidatus Nanohaloarchaea archaeon]